MASIITVNNLPSPGTVNRSLGDVYHWFQTTELTFPYTPLPTPIDHGYYGVDPDIQWLQLATDPHDLPVEFLEKITEKSVTNLVNTSYSKRDEFSLVKKISSSYARLLSYSASIKSSIISKFIQFSSVKKINLVTKRNIFSNTSSIILQSRVKSEQFTRSQIDIKPIGKLIQYGPQKFINLVAHLPPVFADIKSINLTGKKYQFSTRRVVDILGINKLFQFSPVKGLKVQLQKKKFAFTAAEVKIDISLDPYHFYSQQRGVDIPKLSKRKSFSSIKAINIPVNSEKRAFSPVETFDYKIAGPKKQFSGVNKIKSPTKLTEFSYLKKINILFEGVATNVKECDWVLLKKLGVEDWKFFSVLDEMSESIVAPVESNIRFDEMLSATENIDVVYTGSGEVERVSIYRDAAKTTLYKEIYVEYTGDFPFRATYKFFDSFGINYYEAQQTYVPGGAGEILPDTFTVITDFIPSPTAAIPVDPSVSVGDAVYVDNFGTAFPAIATSADTSRVIGFVTYVTGGNQGSIQDIGPLSSFAGLTPGDQYFLDPFTPGQITNIPISSGFGHVSKKLGIATDANTININLQSPFVVRP